MSDRFKFRAWCTEKLAMGYFDMFHQGHFWFKYGTRGEYRVGYTNKHMSDAPSIIIMQCTGLKDKNGVLIYEGDIYVDEVDRRVVVNYEEGMWTEEGYMTGYNFDFSFHSNCEVIGNIYENGNLLTE